MNCKDEQSNCARWFLLLTAPSKMQSITDGATEPCAEVQYYNARHHNENSGTQGYSTMPKLQVWELRSTVGKVYAANCKANQSELQYDHDAFTTAMYSAIDVPLRRETQRPSSFQNSAFHPIFPKELLATVRS